MSYVIAATTSRRWPENSTPSSRCRYGDAIATTALGARNLISTQVVAIDAEDRWAPELNDIDEVERLIPGTVSLIREWFRTYKIPDGKPPNKFALDEKCMGAKYAHKVIHETHTFWCDLVQKQLGDDFGFQLPKLETLRGVANDSKMVRKISNPDLTKLG